MWTQINLLVDNSLLLFAIGISVYVIISHPSLGFNVVVYSDVWCDFCENYFD
jgi:hypothetical protein